MLTARQLEEGAEGLSGRLGDGTGKWQLSVSSNSPVQVMSLIQSTSGLLSNLSRGQAEGPAPTPPPPSGQQPDLVVQSPSVSTTSPSAGQSFRVGVVVRTSSESIGLPAPLGAGRYYYGACIDSVSGESDTTNNCSSAVAVTVSVPPGSQPDMVVESPTVSDSSPDAGQTITLGATVRNQGDGDAGATTVRFYRSSDATISTADTQVGTDAVSGLSASGTSNESISWNAPSDAGTYHYGACVDAVSGESDTTNNCSSAVTVTVPSTPVPPSPYYGAFSLRLRSCSDGGDYSLGVVVDRSTEQEALDAARQACQDDGGSVEDCGNAHSFRQCLAIGFGTGGSSGCALGPGYGATLAEAEANRNSCCSDRQGFTSCTIVASACNSRGDGKAE